MTYFCTYFDKNFLSRGLAMMESLHKYNKKIIFYVLVIDHQTQKKLNILKKKYIKVLTLEKLYKIYPEIKNQKNKRELNEFCFLLTPYLVEYCLKILNLKRIFYTDADLFFFDGCDKIIKKLDKFSIISSVHNFNKNNKFQELINGKFNVGFLGFKKNKISLKCLNLWKKQCFFSTTTHKSFETIIKGDQLYLNEWPQRYKNNFYPITNKFFNIGAWNINDFKFSIKNKIILSNNRKILMVHANFIEFESDHKIVIIDNVNFDILNKIICENYINTSKEIGIKFINISKINLKKKNN